MIASERILPLRIYTDLYEQDRFKKYCHDKCPTILTYSQNRLPSIQFKRGMSIAVPEKLFIKNTCNDPEPNGNVGVSYYKLIPEKAANFQSTNYWGSFPKQQGGTNPGPPPEGVLEDAVSVNECNKLIGLLTNPTYTITTPAEIQIDTATTVGFNNTIKLIVDKFYLNIGSAFKIKIYDGTSSGTLIAEVNTIGVHVFAYPCTQNKITIVFDGYESGDEFEISYIQVSNEVLGGSLYNVDAQLDEGDIVITPLMNGTDVLTLCGTLASANPDPLVSGEYYYVIKMTDGTYYYSELFNIKTPKELENYYKLKWYNQCDLEGYVIYKEETLGCHFYNEVYLEASFFTPAYETQDETKEDGVGNLTSVLKTWQKSISLDVVKSPEYLTDALSAVFLHDKIFIQEPLNQNQEIQQPEYEVIRVTSDVSDIFYDCFQRVNLKMVLSEKYIAAGCCTETPIHDCTPEVYRAGDCNDSGIEYSLTITEPADSEDGLYTCEDTPTLVEPLETDLIYDEVTEKYYYLKQIAGVWTPIQVMPKITSASISGSNYEIEATLIPFVFGKLQQNVDAGGWIDVVTKASNSTGAWEHLIPTVNYTGASDIKFRIVMFTLNCTLGTSDVFDAL